VELIPGPQFLRLYPWLMRLVVALLAFTIRVSVLSEFCRGDGCD
jgi:hypothetical protein